MSVVEDQSGEQGNSLRVLELRHFAVPLPPQAFVSNVALVSREAVDFLEEFLDVREGLAEMSLKSSLLR